MFSIFLFLLTYKILGTAVCAFLSFRIARLRMTPTVTYSLFGIGFSLRLTLYAIGLFHTQSIYGFLAEFSLPLVITTQMMEATLISCFVVGFAKKYGYLTRRISRKKG